MVLLTKLDSAFGKSLKSRRLSSNLSQEQLGLKSGLSRPYISELEMGKKDPSLFTIFKLSNALKVKPSFFINEIEQVISIS
ncbi:helix-turn-helix domain-containing protein [Candidatus Methylopumilus universalis]|uniref:helix-turn-helix domain-containing protein n=1 Tax=Candidatus Methylopumilus universalis TaxID=2588536 RepID=UPI0011247FA2|nr:helix-turn-helix transcriptional regulator [Candidatus Methylopumilus universalis]QDC73049.1 helix-turn-helix transcriptional regulator [Candidatus Methylopumilus universalis]QDC74335.1 helix-turn-helix transcriptional regulator [Candidatus Methylopumilus universalis]QDC75621.1 helix-turn-helix transcriptional regulator [Candidatus Methylopumilus universalis]